MLANPMLRFVLWLWAVACALYTVLSVTLDGHLPMTHVLLAAVLSFALGYTRPSSGRHTKDGEQ